MPTTLTTSLLMSSFDPSITSLSSAAGSNYETISIIASPTSGRKEKEYSMSNLKGIGKHFSCIFHFQTNAAYRLLALWIWPKVMQQELDTFCRIANSKRTRKQKDKILPSGVTPNHSYENPARWGGRECLIQVDLDVVGHLLEGLRPKYEKLTNWGVPEEFARRAEVGLRGIRPWSIERVTITNIWLVFGTLESRIDWPD